MSSFYITFEANFSKQTLIMSVKRKKSSAKRLSSAMLRRLKDLFFVFLLFSTRWEREKSASFPHFRGYSSCWWSFPHCELILSTIHMYPIMILKCTVGKNRKKEQRSWKKRCKRNVVVSRKIPLITHIHMKKNQKLLLLLLMTQKKQKVKYPYIHRQKGENQHKNLCFSFWKVKTRGKQEARGLQQTQAENFWFDTSQQQIFERTY